MNDKQPCSATRRAIACGANWLGNGAMAVEVASPEAVDVDDVVVSTTPGQPRNECAVTSVVGYEAGPNGGGRWQRWS